MKTMVCISAVALVALVNVFPVWANSAPVVSNVSAAQRGDNSKLVDVYYDLADADGDNCTVWIAVQNLADADWRIPVLTVSGHIGASIAPGANRQIVWDAGADIPGWLGGFKVRVYADDGNSPDSLVLIPGGEFQMGDHFAEGEPRELPVHPVYVDSFMMSRFEVTNQQYCEYLNYARSHNEIQVADGIVYAASDSGHTDPFFDTHEYDADSQISYAGSVFVVLDRAGSDMNNHPVVEVSWFGAAAFCNWKSYLAGYQACYNLSTWSCDFSKTGFRLATEAEWEYAARGGLSSRRYPWGDAIVTSQANYWQSGDPFETGAYPWTTPVGFYDGQMHYQAQYNWPSAAASYQTTSGVNGYGLFDITGNVWEWNHDWYSETYYDVSSYGNPTGPTSGSSRVFRGGSWSNDATSCRVAYRSGTTPSVRNNSFGFRLVLDLD